MAAPTFEPELAQPTPRRIAPRDGCALGCGLWFLRLFTLPHTLAGVFLAYQAVRATVLSLGVLLAGVPVEGHVTAKAEHPARRGSYYTADYAFVVGGTEYTGQTQPTAEQYAALREGQPVPIRAWPAAPRDGHRVEGRGEWFVRAVGSHWLIALFWNGILSFAVWKFYLYPWRQRQLVRAGVPAAGVVREVTPQESRKPETYKVRYEYAVPAGHRTPGGVFCGSVTASRPQGAADLNPGYVLTVLYDPRRPRRSLAYRFSDYRAVPPASPPPAA